MAKVTYEILDENLNSFQDLEKFSDKDLSLVDNFTINREYDFSKHYIETHFYSTNDVRLFSSYEYKLPTPALSNDGDRATEVTLDPAAIAQEFGFTRTDIKILFHFLDDLYTTSNQKRELYIHEISKDRTEILLYSEKLSTNELINRTEELKERLESESYFDEYLLNLGNNDLFIVTNINTWELDNKITIALKLYEPLPEKYTVKDKAQVVQKVSDSAAVKLLADVTLDPPETPKLRGPNFTAKTTQDDSEPTEYFDYNDLFSFSNTNSNRELFSAVKDRSINLGIDYSNYENFIHFSSAEERLKNFRYKVQLIETYQSDLDTEEALLNTTSTGRSGSIEATKNLIKGVIDNFDHYEKNLYYESGSNSWPKSNTVKPYVNYHTTSSDAITWYNQQLTSASNYDTRNYDLLTNFLPEYLADDSNNEKGLLFTHMIGQHFDNLWIYTKGITDKYDTDHRLDRGISKDLVQEAIKSLGVKLYNSKEGSNDLFKYFINDSYDSGSINETVNNFIKPYTAQGFASGSIAFSNGGNIYGSQHFVKITDGNGVERTYQGTSIQSGHGAFNSSTGTLLVYFTNPQSGSLKREQFLEVFNSQHGHGFGGLNSISASKFGTGGTVNFTSLISDSSMNSTGANTNPEIGSGTGLFQNTPVQFAGGIDLGSERTTFSNKDYEAQIYKRLYHNIPLLIKSKGTKRGLRALINCFGIPSNFLQITTFGGQRFDDQTIGGSNLYRGPDKEYTSQLDKIRFASGSTDGYVLTQNKSVFREDEVSAPDQHRLEVGFSPTNAINDELINSTHLLSSSFHIDNFIGDPRDLYDSSYNENYPWYHSATFKTEREAALLNEAGDAFLDPPNLKDFVRSLKFYDNILFKMVKDFVPARTSLDTGIIIKPHLLERNKIKSTQLSGNDETYSGSIDTAFMTGSDSGTYNDKIIKVNRDLAEIEASFKPGKVGGYSDLQFRVDYRTDTNQGDFGEIIVEGNDFYHPDGTYYNIKETKLDKSKQLMTPYGELVPASDRRFYAMFSSESIFDRFPSLDTNNGGTLTDWQHSHVIVVDYSPHGQNSWVARGNTLQNSQSFDPLPSDVLLVAFETTGSAYGINDERYRFYQSLGGYVKNTPVSASARVVFQSGSGGTVTGPAFIITGSGQTSGSSVAYRFDAASTTGYDMMTGAHKFDSVGGTAAVKAANFASQLNVLTSFGVNSTNGVTHSFATTNIKDDTVIIQQRNAGQRGNWPLYVNPDLYANGILDPNYPVTDFIGGEDNFKTYSQINDTTFYAKDIETMSGSVIKLVGDESPKFNGELSGSGMLITDGELNDENPFKRTQHPETLFHITTVNQSIADALFPLLVMNDGANPESYTGGANACTAFSPSSTITFYHGGSAAVPVDGDILYSDINATTPVTSLTNSDHISFGVTVNGVTTSYTAQVSASNQPGQLYNIVACSTLDQTAPSGYTAAWKVSAVTANNVTAVTAGIDGTVEANATVFITASDESGNDVKQEYATGTSGGAFTFTANLSSLSDGDDITLALKLRDAAGNTGSLATATQGTGNFGLTIHKQTVGPSGYSIPDGTFRIQENLFFGYAMTQSLNVTAKYCVIVHYNPSFTGTLNYQLSGSHSGTSVISNNISITSGSGILPGTASIVYDDSSAYAISNTGSGASWSNAPNNYGVGNTVGAFIWFTDPQGTSGNVISASVSYYPHLFEYRGSANGSRITSQTYTDSAQTQSLVVVGWAGNTNGNIQEDPNVTWANFVTTDGGYNTDIVNGSSAAQIELQSNGGSARSTTYKVHRLVTDDGYEYEFPIISGGVSHPHLLVTQAPPSTCVDPDTQVLMKTGFTKSAKDLKVGDVIRSKHEYSKEILEDIIIKISSTDNVKKIKITLEDGTYLITSTKHRVYLDSLDDFIAVDTLSEGDIISEKTITSVEAYPDGEVIELTTEKTHTYISNGILSHNGK